MLENLHIAMVVRQLSTSGGLELYAHKVIEGLLARGHSVTVICEESKTDFTHPNLKLVQFPAPLQSAPKYLRLEQQLQAASKAVERSGPFDLVHTQHFPVRNADVVTFHNHSIPYIGKIGFPWENFLNKTKAIISPAYRMRNDCDRQLWQNARSLIFPSNVCRKDFFQQYGLSASTYAPSVVAIPGANLADAANAHPIAETDERQPFTFLFVGRGYRRKGLDITLKACALLSKRTKNFKLKVAGLNMKAIDSLRLSFLGIKQNVEYLGFRKDMSTIFAQSSVFVMPSRHDVFGMAPLQAMQWGIVPIVSQNMGVAELLTNRHNALILENHLDHHQLANLMWEIMNSKSLLQELRSNAASVTELATWDKCVESTLEAYKLASNNSKATQFSQTN